MGNYVQFQNNQSPPKQADEDIRPAVKKQPVYKKIDPNKNYIKYSDLIFAFKTYSTDGFLNLDQFNQAICYLLKFDIPQISFTHLSENVFQLIDKVFILLI